MHTLAPDSNIAGGNKLLFVPTSELKELERESTSTPGPLPKHNLCSDVATELLKGRTDYLKASKNLI